MDDALHSLRGGELREFGAVGGNQAYILDDDIGNLIAAVPVAHTVFDVQVRLVHELHARAYGEGLAAFVADGEYLDVIDALARALRKAGDIGFGQELAVESDILLALLVGSVAPGAAQHEFRDPIDIDRACEGAAEDVLAVAVFP